MSPAAGKPGAGRPAPETGEPAQDAALPPVALVPWGEGGSAVVLQTGAEVADVEAVLARMPGRLVFTEAFGDVDIVLVFDPVAGAPQRPGADAVVRAVLGAGQGRDLASDLRWKTSGERAAYRIGWEEAFVAVRRTVLGASGARMWLTSGPGSAAGPGSGASGTPDLSVPDAEPG